MKRFRKIAACCLALLLTLSGMNVSALAEALILPAELKIIEEEAFFGDTSLDRVTIPDGTTEIRARAFAQSSLTSVYLPASLTFIAEDAFDGCTAFEALCEPDSYAEEWCIDHGVAYRLILPEGDGILATDELTIHEGKTATLRAGAGIDITQYLFETSDASVARVNRRGEITGMAAGEASIYAWTPDGRFGICAVTVEAHTVVTQEGQAATCTEAGLSEGRSCSVCGEVFAAQETLPALGHKWNRGVETKPATVVEDGELVFTCRACGATETRTIPALGSVDPSTAAGERLRMGETLQLSIEDAVTYESSDESIAAVDDSGLVTPVAPGCVSIAARNSDGWCLANTIIWIEGTPSVNETAIELAVGEIRALTGTFSGLEFSSNNPSVAAVGRYDGSVMARAEGTAAITAKTADGSLVAEVQVNVVPHFEYRTEMTLDDGESLSLMIEGPADRWSYTSQDTAIATVDGNGVVTAVSVGSTTIEAVRNDNPEKTFTCEVTVAYQYEYRASLAMNVGDTCGVLTRGAAARWSFTSSNTDVATVDGSGAVTAVSAGSANITAVHIVNTDISFTCAVTVVADQSADFTYSIEDGKAVVTKYNGTESAVSIPGILDGYEVVGIGERAFEYMTTLTSVTIPDSVTSIGYSAFSSCNGLKSVTIPDSVTSIGEWAFRECSSLKSIMIPDGVTSIGAYAFYSCSSLTSIIIPDGVTSIDTCTFYGCRGLKSVTLPDGLTYIGYDAFRYCTGLTSIKIPDSVTHLDGFSYCSGLTSIAILDSVTYLSGFEGWKNLTSFTIPDSVTSIGEGSFQNCANLTSITIPDSVTSIGAHAFYGCTGLTSISIPDSVTYLSGFHGCTGLTSITIPDSVTTIGYYAFTGCTGLTSITIPDSVTSIEHGAFEDCTNLTSITIPDGLTSIGEAVFRGCTGLTFITIPDGVTSIGRNAFYGCTGLTSVTIQNGVTSIEAYAFEGCTGLTSITIPDSVTSIGNYTFYGCTGLKSITIPDGVTSIGAGAFFGCTGLTSITLPNSLTSIGEAVFRGCTGLKSITIPDGVTHIEAWAFYNCIHLTSITIPDSVTSIGNGAFSDGSWNAVFNVTEGSYAHQWCQDNNRKYRLSGSNAEAASPFTLDSGDNINLLAEDYPVPDILLGTGMSYNLNSHFGNPTDPVYTCSDPDMAGIGENFKSYWLYYTAEDGTVRSKQRANSTGSMQALKPGEATITATQEIARKSDTFLLMWSGQETSFPPLVTVSSACTLKVAGFEKDTYDMSVEDGTMTVPISDPCGIAGDSSGWTWSSSNEAFATVDNTGKVTAVGPGCCKITVRFSDSLEASYVLNVGATQSWIYLPEAEWDFTMGFDSKFTLHPGAQPPEVEAVPGGYHFESSDTSIVTCDDSGELTSYQKEGAATITITKEGVRLTTVTCTVRDLKTEDALAEIDGKLAEFEEKYADQIHQLAELILEDCRDDIGLAADAELQLALKGPRGSLTRRDPLYRDFSVALFNYISEECRLSTSDYNQLSSSFDFVNPNDNMVTTVARNLTIASPREIEVISGGKTYIARCSITTNGTANGTAGQFFIHVESLTCGDGVVYTGAATIQSAESIVQLLSVLRTFSDEQTKKACEEVLNESFKQIHLSKFWKFVHGLYKSYDKLRQFDKTYVKSEEGILYTIGKLNVCKKAYDELKELHDHADDKLKNDLWSKVVSLFKGAPSDSAYADFVTGQKNAMEIFAAGKLDDFKGSNIYQYSNMDEIVDGMIKELFNCGAGSFSLLN